MFQKGYKFSTSGAILAIIFFFFPLVMVSCQGQNLGPLSGWQLAAGGEIGSGFSIQKYSGQPIIFLVIIGAIIILVLAFSGKTTGVINKVKDGYGVIISAGIPILIVSFKYTGMQQEFTRQGGEVTTQFGFWGLVASFMVAVYGGYLNLKEP